MTRQLLHHADYNTHLIVKLVKWKRANNDNCSKWSKMVENNDRIGKKDRCLLHIRFAELNFPRIDEIT